MPTSPPLAAAPRRVYVMHRKAWWRLSLEEWWWFVAAQLRSGTAGFPSVNLIGQPRAVVRREDPDGSVSFTSGDAAVWVESIDDWQAGDWAAAATRLAGIGMADAASANGPWPKGATPPSGTRPIYPIEAYQDAGPRGDRHRGAKPHRPDPDR